MNSSSRDILSKFFGEIIQWRHNFPGEIKVQWSELHLSVVRDYVLKSGLNLDFTVLSSIKSFKDTKDPKILASVRKSLQEFFLVPKLHQLSDRRDTVKKNELVAAFINFLLQLLCHKIDYAGEFEDQIEILEKELRFLLAVLGDTLLLSNEHEDVQNLLVEFGALANDAGSLLCSILFSMDPVFEEMNISFGVLLKHIDILKGNITKFSMLPPIIVEANVTPKMAGMDSLFIVDSFLHDLEDLLKQDNSVIVDVEGQIKILHHDLMLSMLSLKDITETEELKEAEVRIRDVAYEAEYLVNSFLVGDAPLWYLSIRLPHVIHKIKLIGTWLQENKRNFDIGALRVANNFSADILVKSKRSIEVDDITVGLEDKETDILDHLVGGKQQLQIILIFGMPGLGKTTLAKKLYNHQSVNYRFDKCSWCIVSQTYQRRNLLIDILISSTGEFDSDKISKMEEEDLAQRLYKSLKGRRYLIVMDDIWSSNAWHDLRRCFPDDGNGSRILLTSRNKDVAPPNSNIHALSLLSNEQCWELLEKKVFQNNPCPAKLEETGKGIAAKCCGLPLAIVVIAGILSTINKEESAWKNVGRNLASHIFDGGGNHIMQILELSYKHLPDQLKPCFLYFGAFPEDTEVPAQKLIRLWIAEGFICKEQSKSSESVARQYLKQLIDRSLVMVAERRTDDEIGACVIHDLLRALCLKISEGENFLKMADNNYSIYEKGHRVVSLQHSVNPFGLHVRSYHGYHSDLQFYVRNMTLLRVMDMKSMTTAACLIGIQFMVNLRYLAIGFMPASVGCLVNLEFLTVTQRNLGTIFISPEILKLLKLRYLQVSPSARYGKECYSLQTNNLEFISNLEIREPKDEEMLKCSPHLRKLKCRCQPLWVEENGTYRYPDLRFLTQLESLKMIFIERHGMAEISLPLNIKKLTLALLLLPWERMSIIGGLPNLEVLKLTRDAFVGRVWETRDGEFQQLKCLKLSCLDLAEWNVASSKHFPRLQQLVLFSCQYLQEIPYEIGEISTMQSVEVRYCTETVANSARKIQQEQLEMGNEEFINIILNNSAASTDVLRTSTKKAVSLALI